jgi:hypothetical protein
MEEPSLVFIGLWFGIYLRLPSKKYKIFSWKKNEFEDQKDLLDSFTLNFVTLDTSSEILCPMYV